MNERDRTLIRDLAKRVAEIAARPEMGELRETWKRHHGLERVRPMILVFPENSWNELLPADALHCEDPLTRQYEANLRRRLYYFDNIRDDTVIEGTYIVSKAISNTGWGLKPQWVWSDQKAGAGTYKPVIESPDDLKKLRFPEVIHDEAESLHSLEHAQDLLGDILDVKLKGIRTVSFHLMNIYARLRGLDQVMMDMYEAPEMLHEAMAFLEQGHQKLINQYEEQNLLSLNNDDAYVYPGGNGYSDELPPTGYDPDHIRPRDMWASAEAQELTLVSPAMTYEFALQYEKRLLERFGLTAYGCCEDLTRKLDHVFTIPNLRQVNISPFADADRCAEQFRATRHASVPVCSPGNSASLGKDIIFAWKPHPSHLVGNFDEDRIREHIRHALDVSRGLVVEIALKDTHTCENHPERFTHWVEIAREECEGY